jgi:hypothetical protein
LKKERLMDEVDRRPLSPFSDRAQFPGCKLAGQQEQEQEQRSHSVRGDDGALDVLWSGVGDEDENARARARSDSVPQLRTLLGLHAAGAVDPEPVADLGPLPPNPTRAMVELHALLKLRFGLRLGDGTDEPMMLATSELVEEGIVRTQSGASKLLHRFEDLGIIWSPGSMPALGRPDGTRMFLPGRRPEGEEPPGGWRVAPANNRQAPPRVAPRRRAGRRPSVAEMVERALLEARPGSRNAVGFKLACQLRDSGRSMGAAIDALGEYQQRVTTGGDPYTIREALASVRQAYRRDPRWPAVVRS